MLEGDRKKNGPLQLELEVYLKQFASIVIVHDLAS